MFRCTRCHRHVSVTAGTILHGSHLPLAVWLYAIAMVGGRKQSISAKQLAKDTNIAYSSAWALLHKIRRGLRPTDERALRCGVVELARVPLDIEDARLWPRSHWEGTAELVVAVERLDDGRRGRRRRPLLGRMRASFIVPTSSTARFRAEAIAERAVVIEKPQRLGRTIASNVIAWLRGTFHGVSIKYLQAYLDEASFRFSRRRREALLPSFIGARLLTCAPVTRAALRDPPRPPEPLPPAPPTSAAPPCPASPASEPPSPVDEAAAQLAPELRAELRRLLAIEVTSRTPPIAVHDIDLFLTVSRLRPILPLRLEA